MTCPRRGPVCSGLLSPATAESPGPAQTQRRAACGPRGFGGAALAPAARLVPSESSARLHETPLPPRTSGAKLRVTERRRAGGSDLSEASRDKQEVTQPTPFAKKADSRSRHFPSLWGKPRRSR
ncbi:hypothetical protein AAFF_G00072940 [Aldrovandia affinis]|uniref:Uncharacterized protein n=1 Tax=Aldrovandia affinis TaxID=143900 RepID=A0AAD7RYF0_9TELE|nr:hypothetical protein AAFF_G00072940 [Aldrovandia affinis]